jgi:TatD DNase family protein
VTVDFHPLIDTHAHLDDRQFDADLDGVIERAIDAGVARIINVGYRPASWKTTLALAERTSIVAFTFGLHPHHADEWSESTRSDLRALLSANRPVALGEIGLDYFRNLSSKADQARVFTDQLDIAAEFKLPVVIHQRDAEQDLMHILERHDAGLVCVLHSFDGTFDLADFATERGYCLGVGGLMTRASATVVRDVIKTTQMNRLLIETDSPFLVPARLKNRRNEPANVALVAEQLARLLDVPVPQVVDATTTNAERVFGPLLSATTPPLKWRR